MKKRRLIIAIVWSSNPLLPRAGMIMKREGSRWYHFGPTNSHGRHCYRLCPKIIKP